MPAARAARRWVQSLDEVPRRPSNLADPCATESPIHVYSPGDGCGEHQGTGVRPDNPPSCPGIAAKSSQCRPASPLGTPTVDHTWPNPWISSSVPASTDTRPRPRQVTAGRARVRTPPCSPRGMRGVRHRRETSSLSWSVPLAVAAAARGYWLSNSQTARSLGSRRPDSGFGVGHATALVPGGVMNMHTQSPISTRQCHGFQPEIDAAVTRNVTSRTPCRHHTVIGERSHGRASEMEPHSARTRARHRGCWHWRQAHRL